MPHLDLRHEFASFGSRVWLNCAHQGPLSNRAEAEALEAIAWKRQPWNLTTDRFSALPLRVKAALAGLIGAPREEIVLANSASYGLHLLANGFPWEEGDEVVVVEGDFPSDILPWLGLEKQGVTVKRVRPRNHVLAADELAAALGPKSRLFCCTWVHSLSGRAADLTALGEVCRAAGVTFVVNGSQAVGARPLAVGEVPIDALVSVGFKWLCGPYGTGFCWLRRELLESLRLNQAYWLSMQTADDLGAADRRVELPPGPPTARTYDIFGTANFFNFKPWAAAIELVNEVGVERIAAHDQALVQRFLDGVDEAHYEVTSPREGDERSTLIFLRRRDGDTQALYDQLRAADVGVAWRNGHVRVAPHFYNVPADVDRALEVLGELAVGDPHSATKR